MRCVVLTGAVHVGKSTVCLKVVRWARQQDYRVRGVVTTPLCDPPGFPRGFELRDLESDERRMLAHVDGAWGGPSVGPYHFDPAVLRWGTDIVERALTESCDLLVLDEIGRLELEQAAGFHSLLRLLAIAAVPRMLIVVRGALLDAFRSWVPELRFSTLEVTAANRDALSGEVSNLLFDCTRPGR